MNGQFRYIGAEQIPVKYGGLSKDGEFDATDAVTEITLRPAAKHTVEFPATEVRVDPFFFFFSPLLKDKRKIQNQWKYLNKGSSLDSL